MTAGKKRLHLSTARKERFDMVKLSLPSCRKRKGEED